VHRLVLSRRLEPETQNSFLRSKWCASRRAATTFSYRGSIGPIALRTTLLKMTLPPTRPLGQTLVLSAVVIGTMALGAVILWAATHWLWLVVHQRLH